MNDEIKEILDYLTKFINNEEEILDYLAKFINDKEEITKYGCEISVKQAKTLLDYITNLQQENERLRTELNAYENPDDLTLFYMWLDEKAKYKMKKLQQENERLKDELETMTFTAKVKQEAIDALIKRIDKAIEYIEKELFTNKDDLEWCRKNDGYISGSDLPADVILSLYDILKGDSDETV